MSGKAWKVGDVVSYQHQNVVGTGKILSMGRDGCWFESLERDPWQRRRCTVRHENILPPEGRATEEHSAIAMQFRR